MDEHYYRQLVKRYLDNTATNDELEVFVHLVNEGKLDTHLKAALNKEACIADDDTLPVKGNAKKTYLLMPVWLKYAAAIILFSSVTATLFYLKPWQAKQPLVVNLPVQHDALPGGNKAVLTLANGQKIILGNSINGMIARQGDTKVEKIQDGHLVYQRADSAIQGITDTQLAYNTISTPKGGQYAVTLPDGSKVWLNSISSITFPTEFKGQERKVRITGEVYFEVAKNKDVPFVVESKCQDVRVLGTHFNINAYDDENKVRTTLLEGSVKVTAENNSRTLMPGQQAEVVNHLIKVIDGSDTQAAVAWKNGNFVFDHADLPSLMRQLSRWYDVTIVYNGTIGQHEFVGQIKRSVNLSSVLKILAVSGIHFTVEGKNLYIQP